MADETFDTTDDRPAPGRTDRPAAGRTDRPAPGRTDRPAAGRTDRPAPGRTDDRPAPGRTDRPAPGRTDDRPALPLGVDWDATAADLRRDGFCVVPGLLDENLLARLRPAGDALGESWTAKLGDLLRAQGSMVSVPHLHDPVFGELIANPRTLAVLDRLGLDGPAFTAGYVISKPPQSPRLFWHFDWYGWDDESSYEPEPKQLFVMYYLTDTSIENGCLRVIPGSHMGRHPLHDVMADGHVELSNADDLSRPEFRDWPEERAVPVRAGDAVLGDARLLHAAYANDTDERRSLVTLWYHPHFAQLPEPVQATFATYVQDLPDAWPAETRAAVARLHPAYTGGATALPRTTHGPRRSSVDA